MTHLLSNHRCITRILLCIFLVLLVAPAHGQIRSRRIDSSLLSEDERRESALLWLDTFFSESGLLDQKGFDKMQDGVNAMNASQLQRWLEQIEQLREYADSDKWQQTKPWLREMLRVQAIYSEKELKTRRAEIANADASQLLAFLKRIQASHDALVWMQQASERNRQVEVAERDAYLAEQAAAAQAARSPAPAQLPLYGGGLTGGSGEKPSRGYYVPFPMISSREMSRAAVWSELWGPGWLIGF